MADDDIQALVRRLFEDGFDSADPASVSDIIDKDYDSNDGGFFRTGSDVPGGLERLSGTDAFVEHVHSYQRIYDNLLFTTDKMITDGNTVITLWTASGTTKNRTIVNRAGRAEHIELAEQGVSLTGVAKGKVTRHDMFWPGGLNP